MNKNAEKSSSNNMPIKEQNDSEPEKPGTDARAGKRIRLLLPG